jgi:hypothetical protein
MTEVVFYYPRLLDAISDDWAPEVDSRSIKALLNVVDFGSPDASCDGGRDVAMPLESDDDEERLVRIEQMMESLKTQTAELDRLTKRAAVRTVEVQKRSRTLQAQTQTTRKHRRVTKP